MGEANLFVLLIIITPYLIDSQVIYKGETGAFNQLRCFGQFSLCVRACLYVGSEAHYSDGTVKETAVSTDG